jgi:hypothetical protein
MVRYENVANTLLPNHTIEIDSIVSAFAMKGDRQQQVSCARFVLYKETHFLEYHPIFTFWAM